MKVGDRVVYQGINAFENLQVVGNRRLYTRSFTDYEIEMLRGSEGSEQPFFSPDGRWIAFFDGQGLAKVPAAGGARGSWLARATHRGAARGDRMQGPSTSRGLQS